MLVSIFTSFSLQEATIDNKNMLFSHGFSKKISDLHALWAPEFFGFNSPHLHLFFVRQIMPGGGTFYREKPRYFSWHVFFWHVICCNLEPKCDKQISYQLGFLPKLWSKNTQNTQLQIGDPTNNCDWLCWMLSKMPPIGKRHWNFSTSVRAVRNTFLLCFSIGEFPIK